MAEFITIEHPIQRALCNLCGALVCRVYVPSLNKTVDVDPSPALGGAPPTDTANGAGIPHANACPNRRMMRSADQMVRE